ASRRHDAARGRTRARLRRRRAVRRMGAPARHDGSERLSAGAGAAEAGRRRGSLSILRALWPFLAPYRGRIALAVGALLVAAGATLVVPLAFRQLIDVGFAAPGTDAVPVRVDTWFVALFGVAVLLALATALRFYSVAWLGERVSADLRRAVYRQVLRQDARFFETLK